MQNTPPRPHTHAYLALSLDGRLAGPNDDLSWLNRYQHTEGTEGTEGPEPEDTGFSEHLASVDTLLMGRRSYEVVRGFGEGAWPYSALRVRILTHRPLTPAHGEEGRAGDIREVLTALHAEGARRVYVDGGEVIRQCLDAGALDALTLFIAPTLLGDGPRLFDGALPRSEWRLVSSRAYASGLLRAELVPAR